MFQNKYICSLIQSFLFLVACVYGVHKFTHVQRSEDLRYLPWSPPYFSDRVSHWNPKLADSASQAGRNCHVLSSLPSQHRITGVCPGNWTKVPKPFTNSATPTASITCFYTSLYPGYLRKWTPTHPPTHIFSAASLSLDIIKKCQHKS